MKKRRIVIASTLKPVDDTRAYEKFAVTLAQEGCEVFIIGYPSTSKTAYANIHFLPMRRFERLSLYRWILPLVILWKVRQVRPEALIVNTHELLIVAVLNRIFFGTKIFYDVQENYYLNMIYSSTIMPPFRQMLAGYIRLKERVMSAFFHGFFLAEKCYEHELSFLPRRSTVIENKAVIPEGFTRVSEPGKIRLLFSGTLAESTGVFYAIELAEQLNRMDGRIGLTIIGHAPLPRVLVRLQSEVKRCQFIRLIGGAEPVPHGEIVEAIRHADFGIVQYPLTPATRNRIPTKLFEYVGYGLPLLLQHHAPWLALCRGNRAIPLDQNPSALLAAMQSIGPSAPAQGDVHWTSEAKKLTGVIFKFI